MGGGTGQGSQRDSQGTRPRDNIQISYVKKRNKKKEKKRKKKRKKEGSKKGKKGKKT